MKRPALSDNSFLGHVFSPKKHAQPTGLRKTTLKGTRNTSKRRVTAFNRMSPVNQEILKRSGKRDAYLRGESSLADAKQELRTVAVQLGIAKPSRGKAPSMTSRRDALDAMIAAHLKNVLRDAGRDVNPLTIDAEIVYLDEPTRDMLDWDYGHIKYAGRKESEYQVVVDGRTHNPFWYH